MSYKNLFLDPKPISLHYYSIVTSELNMAEGDIIDTYRGLWEIGETFGVTKQGF
jgi:hypothetical protein